MVFDSIFNSGFFSVSSGVFSTGFLSPFFVAETLAVVLVVVTFELFEDTVFVLVVVISFLVDVLDTDFSARVLVAGVFFVLSSFLSLTFVDFSVFVVVFVVDDFNKVVLVDLGFSTLFCLVALSGVVFSFLTGFTVFVATGVVFVDLVSVVVLPTLLVGVLVSPDLAVSGFTVGVFLLVEVVAFGVVTFDCVVVVLDVLTDFGVVLAEDFVEGDFALDTLLVETDPFCLVVFSWF